MRTFAKWYLANVERLGFENIPLHEKITCRFDDINKMFGNTLTVQMVNPQSDDPPTSTLGETLYEHLAESAGYADDKCDSLFYGMCCFSWQYPQLKMHVHEVREVEESKAVTLLEEDDGFLDNVEFVIEFLS